MPVRPRSDLTFTGVSTVSSHKQERTRPEHRPVPAERSLTATPAGRNGAVGKDVNAAMAASRRVAPRPTFRTVRTLAEVPGAEERMGAEMLRQLSLGHRARYVFDDEAQAVRRPTAASCGRLDERANRSAA